MNLPLSRSPSSDPPGRTAEPPMAPHLSPQLGAQPRARVDVERVPADVSLTAAQQSGLHAVSAIYPSRAEAEGVRQHLVERGFASAEIRVIADASDSPVWSELDETGRDEVLKSVLVDGAIGTAVGTGVGVIGTVALAAASVTLFVASPVVAPLAMLGWFAGLGGVVGAAMGANRHKDDSVPGRDDRGDPDLGNQAREGKFSELVREAIEAGNTALVVRTHGQAERELATRIISDSLLGTDQTPVQS